MKSLYNLPIRAKFGIIIVPLVLIIVFFDIFQIRDHYLDYKDSSRLNKAINLGIEINHVVHEIQKERSVSAGYLSSDGDQFLEELSKQRQQTNDSLNAYFEDVKRPLYNDLMVLHKGDIDKLDNYFDKLEELRKSIDNRSMNSNEVINAFAEINSIALNTVNLLINESRDKEVTQEVHAMSYFLKSKEYASIERAVGTQILSSHVPDPELFRRFGDLVASQNAFTEAFRLIANSEAESYYDNIVEGKEVEEVNRLREAIAAKDILLVNPGYWYNVVTGKINSLKRVEDYLAESIHNQTINIAKRANWEFWSVVILDVVIGIITFLLTWMIAANLLNNVERLENFTRKLSAGDLSKKVRIDSKDELGQYAKTFNKMIEEINKSHKVVKRARDEMKVKYENSYKQSEVILENVQQGIFLLDKDFKISNQYSKATEEIFENGFIAGENFANFMRPLVIPRDLEALEMFMRHLFNDDMDEEVVNQLNPVEEVKIFTDNEGSITTKYVRILFSRVIRDEVIQNILVTVSDETESVLLQQHIDENEANKKLETEQLLSILKIDPSLLRGFLFNSRKGLRSISEEYELNGDKDMGQLLEFTFRTIHNIKGNASLTGLQIVTDKLHSIEDTITNLKSKVVKGNDFLSLLYEIDEVDKILIYMSELLRKVADIYKNFPTTGHVVSNILVIDSLEKGLQRISKEIGKDVNFDFENEDNLVIPDHYITPFKDIMIQLIRNSLAHGIEERSVRVSQGKIEKGTISITLDKGENDEILIAYFDDGRGLDMKKIQESAISRGIIPNKLDDNAKIVDLLFESGFSTADEIDEYAGRGEGLGLVKSIVKEHNGTFKINSESRKFFEMEIRFPVTDNPETEGVA
ncbi:MAG: nitrate- and nitrite sensing domain-containing protein [Bacteroidota bacterium]